jgi:hypothetical protein
MELFLKSYHYYVPVRYDKDYKKGRGNDPVTGGIFSPVCQFMGADAPLSPILMDAAAPKGAPRRLKKLSCVACR